MSAAERSGVPPAEDQLRGQARDGDRRRQSGGGDVGRVRAGRALRGVAICWAATSIPRRREFSLPEIDQVFEPTFTMRWFKTMGDFAMGMEGWGMADYRPFLDQLAKLKFNRIRVGGCPSAPFLDLRLKGVRRQSAVLWYGEHYPITPDMPGRRLFGDAAEFWNPDLPPPGTSCEEMVAAGQRHMHALIAYARSRGIEASSVWSITDFPKEFRAVIPDAQTVNQLGQLTVAPGPTARPDNPDLDEIGGTLIRTILDEYPDAAQLRLSGRHGVPELDRAARLGVAGTRQAVRHRVRSAAGGGSAAGRAARRSLGGRSGAVGDGSQGAHHRAVLPAATVEQPRRPAQEPQARRPACRLRGGRGAVAHPAADPAEKRRAVDRDGLQPDPGAPPAQGPGDRSGQGHPHDHGPDASRRQRRHAPAA